MKVVRLSALHTGRLYPLEIFLVLLNTVDVLHHYHIAFDSPTLLHFSMYSRPHINYSGYASRCSPAPSAGSTGQLQVPSNTSTTRKHSLAASHRIELLHKEYANLDYHKSPSLTCMCSKVVGGLDQFSYRMQPSECHLKSLP
jgi:hypothetical protein